MGISSYNPELVNTITYDFRVSVYCMTFFEVIPQFIFQIVYQHFTEWKLIGQISVGIGGLDLTL